MIKCLILRIYQRYLFWKFRNVDPSICCCGETMGQGGSICAHGGCRSAREYSITLRIQDLRSKLYPTTKENLL